MNFSKKSEREKERKRERLIVILVQYSIVVVIKQVDRRVAVIKKCVYIKGSDFWHCAEEILSETRSRKIRAGGNWRLCLVSFRFSFLLLYFTFMSLPPILSHISDFFTLVIHAAFLLGLPQWVGFSCGPPHIHFQFKFATNLSLGHRQKKKIYHQGSFPKKKKTYYEGYEVKKFLPNGPILFKGCGFFFFFLEEPKGEVCAQYSNALR